MLGGGSKQRQVRAGGNDVEGNKGRGGSSEDGTSRFGKVGEDRVIWQVWIRVHAEGEGLKPYSTDRVERGMIAVQGRLFVEEYRDLQLCSYSLPQSLCQMNTILHRRTA